MELTLKQARIDEGHRMAIGWAVISTIDGEPYVDTDDDWIPDDVVFDAAVRYAGGDRVGKVMHAGATVGRVVLVMPLTIDVMKALGVESAFSGLAVGMKLDEGIAGDAALEAVKAGILKGFSIGGGLARRKVTA